MRVIIAGGREIEDYDAVSRAISDSKFDVSLVVSGGCRGVDRCGERWAKAHGVPMRRYRADWANHGKAAGPIRNFDMASNADALVLVWSGMSPGSANMLGYAQGLGLKIHQHIIESVTP